MTPAAQLRALMQAGLVMAPGAHDGMSAKLIERSGFPAIYLGTGALSASVFGRPDIELTTLTELTMVVKAVCDAVRVPVIVDADTGFGGLHNVMRTVRDMEAAGAAAIHLEDQPVPKRCGYFEGGGLLPVDEMREKIVAALDARRDPDFVIIARVDAGFLPDFSEAIERALAYRDAGADMIFVNGMTTREQTEQVIREVPAQHLYNVSGSDRAPILGADEIAALGYKLAIYPLQAMRLAGQAMQDMFDDLKRTGAIAPWLPKMLTFAQYQEITGASEALVLESKYAAIRTAGTGGKNRP